jgi:hypothetical protein
MPSKNAVILEDVHIIFRNFSGKEGMYNREGDRNFAVVLPADVGQQLANDGWNVKVRKAREEGEEDLVYLSVAVNFKSSKPPMIKLITERGSTIIDESMVETLDWVDIKQVDLIINPYDWKVRDGSGRKAYLESLYMTIIEDPLQVKYADIATVNGPMMDRTEALLPND